MAILPTHSLRARLLWLLLAAVLAGTLTQGLFAYRTALAEADEIFDYHMQQMAMSLRSGLPPSAAVSASGPAGRERDHRLRGVRPGRPVPLHRRVPRLSGNFKEKWAAVPVQSA